MDTNSKMIVSLDEAHKYPVALVGGKTLNVAISKKAGLRVPDGFCLTTNSYKSFLDYNKLYYLIDKEVTRKSFDDMRWEEIWDSALRIRSSFMNGKVPELLETYIEQKLSAWDDDSLFSVRSSSVEEDSKTYSFAGVHESFVNVPKRDVIDKIKLVWASLWNDRSLLYKKEKQLDSAQSAMAVLVQKMEKREISGLIFTADPTTKDKGTIVIETIKGSLNLLVDNVQAPERVKIDRNTGEIKEHMLLNEKEILSPESVRQIYSSAMKLENIFGESLDIEWTGLGDRFTVLQVRPITGVEQDPVSERRWYLTLTPKGQKLIDLAERVEDKLIPELEMESEKFSEIFSELLSREEFLDQLRLRGQSYEKWAKIYWDEFIPFAHGIRNFGVFYNDLMNPIDPYQFVYLLKSEDLIAYRRNNEIRRIAELLNKDRDTRKKISHILDLGYKGQALVRELRESTPGFSDIFAEFLKKNMNLGYEGTRLEEKPEIPLAVMLNLSEDLESGRDANRVDPVEYTRLYLDRAKEDGILEEAERWLRIGRVSWKLRDDDNILLGRLENQLLIFMEKGIELLKLAGNIAIVPEKLNLKEWKKIYNGIANGEMVSLEIQIEEDKLDKTENTKPRQLLGQPSSPGLYTGKARVVRSLRDFKDVEKGEVLVFDSVQPQMTFIISLAGAIVERRGGMLVHSSIIAREMHIPSVNGVSKATKLIKTGDLVTVNGDLGIVTIGSSSLFEL